MNRPPFQSFGTTIMSCAPLIATRSTVFCAAADPDSSANATTAAARRALMRWVSSRCTPLAARQGRVVVVRGRVSVVVVRGRVSVVVVVVAETRGQMLSITLPMPSSDATLSTQSLWTSFSIVVAFPVQPVVWLKRVANLASTLSMHPPGVVSTGRPFSAALAWHLRILLALSPAAFNRNASHLLAVAGVVPSGNAMRIWLSQSSAAISQFGVVPLQPVYLAMALVKLPDTFVWQLKSLELSPVAATFASQLRSPRSFLPIALNFPARHLPPVCALAGLPVGRTSASTPAVAATSTGNRGRRTIVVFSLPASTDGALFDAQAGTIRAM